MSSQFETIRAELLTKIHAATDVAALEEARVEALGKKGRLTDLMKAMTMLAPEARKAQGAALNTLKDELTSALDARKMELQKVELNARLITEKVDVTLPTRPENVGRIHPISRTIEEIIEIFAGMGFTWVDGPNIESDDYNFTKLNIPPEHPARQMQDTLYMPERDGQKMVLRTQTSAVQIRAMLANKPPLRVLTLGRVYRNESDATHSPMFHQFEGLVIDEINTITMAHLKGTLLDFYRTYFGVADLPIRFRPSFFPFTEPSCEVDIGCSRKNGEIKIGNHGDWLEAGGCGMVHPKVLEGCGIDPTKYQGFAFGMGVDRAPMLKYGIPDIRNFFESDVRWMKHYGFLPFDVPTLAQGTV